MKAMLGAAVWMAACLAGAQPGPPPAGEVVDNYHGVSVADPFRPLEDLAAPATQAWLASQGDWARAQLDAIPGRAALANRIDELSIATGDRLASVSPLSNGAVIYLKRSRGEGQFKLLLRPRAGAPERVLFDPNARIRPGDPPLSIDSYMPSWDGRHVAFTIAEGGSEQATLHVLDVATGKEVVPPVPRIGPDSLSWTPDSRGLAFNQLRALEPGAPATETYLDSSVMLLRIDKPGMPPRPVFGRLLQPRLGLERLDFGTLLFHPASRYVVARTTDTTLPEGRLFVARIADLAGPAQQIRWKPVATAADGIVQVIVREHGVLLRSRKDAPNGRILELDPSRPLLARARVLVPEAPDRVITDLQLASRGALWLSVRQGFTVRVQGWTAGRFSDPAPRARGQPGPGGRRQRTQRCSVPVSVALDRAHQTVVPRFAGGTLGAGRPASLGGTARNAAPGVARGDGAQP